jgi:hypothetical protein
MRSTPPEYDAESLQDLDSATSALAATKSESFVAPTQSLKNTQPQTTLHG